MAICTPAIRFFRRGCRERALAGDDQEREPRRAANSAKENTKERLPAPGNPLECGEQDKVYAPPDRNGGNDRAKPDEPGGKGFASPCHPGASLR
jgi:hypothetical protein